MKPFVLALVLATLPTAAAAQQLAIQPTSEAPAAAAIADAAWLAGRWVGEGLGGQVEEVWSQPIGPLMIGHFTLSQDGALVFSEHMMIEERDGGLVLRVKHFNPDFTGWEEKDDSVDFRFISAAPGELRFRSLILRAIGADRLEIVLTMRQSDGSARDEVFSLRRAPL